MKRTNQKFSLILISYLTFALWGFSLYITFFGVGLTNSWILLLSFQILTFFTPLVTENPKSWLQPKILRVINKYILFIGLFACYWLLFAYRNLMPIITVEFQISWPIQMIAAISVTGFYFLVCKFSLPEWSFWSRDWMQLEHFGRINLR